MRPRVCSPLHVSLVAASLALAGGRGWADGLVITEFMAVNGGTLVDASGGTPDWIEVYNPGPGDVVLDGWALTDDADPAGREPWFFPEGEVLEAGAYRVVLASGLGESIVGGEWHASFRLSGGGEFLALLDPSGAVAQAFEPGFPPQLADVSYGSVDSDGGGGDPVFRFLSTPTPGASNAPAGGGGPVIFGAANAPLSPAEGVDLAVTVSVAAGGAAGLEEVFLFYRVMFGSERPLRMRDDGVPPDSVAGDGVFAARISSHSLLGLNYSAGQMLRWYFTARDTGGQEVRLPAEPAEGEDAGRYFGTVVADPAAASALPVLDWFTDDPDGADRTSGARSSAFFGGRFYDNFFTRRRGQFGAIDWAKPKYKFDFNPGEHFAWEPGERRVEEFNLQSHYRERGGATSYMRENLSFAVFRDAGTPAPRTRHWHVRRNGAYHGLFSFVEQVDGDFLRHHGFDPDGAMYKANGFPSTLALGVTRALYQKETRKEEPYDDLEAFVAGINGAGGVDRSDFVMDYVDIPALVNEMACQAVLSNHDRLTKNYYVYRDPATDLWHRFPWDLEQSFAIRNDENFGSPLYGDTEHPQAPGQAIYQNFLLDAVLDHPLTREMYLRRLRTLTDRYLADGAPFLTALAEALREEIGAEADRDNARWSAGDIDAGLAAIFDDFLPFRLNQLTVTYGPGGRGLVPAAQTPGLDLEFGALDYRPAGGDPLAEYFSLRNPNSEALDIGGWTVSGAVDFTFPPGSVIGRRGSLLVPEQGVVYVARDVRAFRARQVGPGGGRGLFFIGSYDGQLSARGETLTLRDAAGRTVAERTYAGDPSPAQRHLRVTEIDYHPAASAAEAAAGFRPGDFEFIELKNNGADPLDLAGVTLSGAVGFVFPDGAILPAGGYALVVANAGAFAFRHGAEIGVSGVFEGRLANGGEELAVRDAHGENIVKVDYADTWHPSTDGGGSTLAAADEGAPFDAWGTAGAWRPSGRPGGSPGAADGGPSGPANYLAWRVEAFGAAGGDDAVAGPGADPDGDGLANLVEYALALDPLTAGNDPAGAPAVVAGGGGGPGAPPRFTFRRRRDAGDVTVTVERSSDLGAWDSAGPAETTENNGDGSETVTYSAGQGEGRVFFRLRVSLRP